jgi:YidC/Oxa1 family membrane protein insertase
MDRRFSLFLLLATALLMVNLWFYRAMNPQVDKPTDDDGAAPAKTADDGVRRPLEAPPVDVAPAEVVEEPAAPRQWVTLGSADPDSDYRMLVVLTSRGAGVEWAALNSPRFLDLDALFYRRGYLGYLALTPARRGGGAVVNVVGPGTPAYGTPDHRYLEPGDVIISIVGPRDKEPTSIAYPNDLEDYLTTRSRFDESVELQVIRNGQTMAISVPLGKRPLELLKPERAFDPALSFLLTLEEVDRTAGSDDAKKADAKRDGTKKDDKDDPQKLKLKKKGETGITFAKGVSGAVIESVEPGSPADKAGLRPQDTIVQLDKVKVATGAEFNDALEKNTVPTGAFLDVVFKRGEATQTSTVRMAMPAELKGVNLYAADWETIQTSDSTVEFRRKVPSLGLQFIKRYTLANKGGAESSPGAGYQLSLDVEIRRLSADGTPLKLAYQLDGPQGLPTEGWWYASKISRTWDSAGACDLVYSLGSSVAMMNAPNIGGGHKLRVEEPTDSEFDFVAVDARYFSAAVIPMADGDDPKPSFFRMQPLVVGDVDDSRLPTTNTSFRLITKPVDLAEGPLKHSYAVFLGPKEKDVLSQQATDLEELIYYGWPVFSHVARIMVRILHFFYSLPPYNYGVAIILLTVLVRLCMFPLSRKQALGAQKMQKIQPELKRLAEKHKNDYEGRAKAQRELFRKHNYNPASGCLPIFVQLPIFIGLYKGLSLATELRQAPLIPGFYWCSDLSAPDRLWHWKDYLPDFLASETGYLGPYFNLLPIITIVLFIVQQKMFMPPPTDEQQRLQQKMMNFMMIFMGIMFFKVPSGLCIYFIASSLWGIAERKLLPKIAHETEEAPVPAVADARKAVSEKGKPRGEPQGATPRATAPQGALRRASERLGETALGKLFKNLSAAADNQPRTEAGKRRQKKRGKGGK